MQSGSANPTRMASRKRTLSIMTSAEEPGSWGASQMSDLQSACREQRWNGTRGYPSERAASSSAVFRSDSIWRMRPSASARAARPSC